MLSEEIISELRREQIPVRPSAPRYEARTTREQAEARQAVLEREALIWAAAHPDFDR